jgi:hypothetical protein
LSQRTAELDLLKQIIGFIVLMKNGFVRHVNISDYEVVHKYLEKQPEIDKCFNQLLSIYNENFKERINQNMASFQKYSTKQGQLWMFKMDTGINPETGKRQTTTRRGFKTKKEAQFAAAMLEQEIANGLLINNNNLTYGDVFEQWFSNHTKTIKVSTQKTIESKFKRHILPRFAKLKIKDISKAYCQKMINEIADT